MLKLKRKKWIAVECTDANTRDGEGGAGMKRLIDIFDFRIMFSLVILGLYFMLLGFIIA